MNKTTQNGFTLYELLMTTLVLGVVLAIGVPNMMDLTRNSRVTATANDLHSSFYMARSEAARSKNNVTICGSANSLDAAADCGATFAEGWIVFQDIDGDISRDNNEPILRAHPAVPEQLSISMPGMDSYFSFAPTGLGRGNVTGVPAVSTAVICDERGNEISSGGSSAARVLVITPLGRATVIRDIDMITTLINNTGATCP